MNLVWLMGFCMLFCSEDCTSHCLRPCEARSSPVGKACKTSDTHTCVTEWLGSKSARVITYQAAAPIVIRSSHGDINKVMLCLRYMPMWGYSCDKVNLKSVSSAVSV